jgi:SulP family sulfate permease
MARIALFEVLREEFDRYDRHALRQDVMAGISVAAVALPLSLAFGIASGATAAAGLVTAMVAGLVMGIFSGTPNQISGPTGAMSAVLLLVARDYGLEGVWVTTLMAGVMILLVGVLRLGRVVLFIPRPVVTGFTSGIAIVIFTGQVHNLLNVDASSAITALQKWAEFFGRVVNGALQPDWHTLVTGGIVIAVMFLLPKSFGRVAPPALIGVAIATIVTLMAGFPEPVVGAMPRGLWLPERFAFGPHTLELAGNLFVPAASVTILCCLQALLSASVCGNLTGRPMDNDQELIGQGIGNLVLPFFGGVPATGAVARTRVGIAAGGRTRVTTIVHGLVLILAALLLGDVIAQIPVAALSGVLIVTTIRMNDWDDIRWMFRHRFKSAIAAFLATMLATAAFDLTQAILIGLALSALAFMVRASAVSVERKDVDVKALQAIGHQIESVHPDMSVVYITGPMFFGAAARLRAVFAQHECERFVILSMRGVPYIDVSGLELIEEIWEKQRKCGGELLLAAVQPAVREMLDRSKLTAEIGAHNFFWSADRAILAANARVTM